MKKCNMIKGSINSIETFGLVDGPGIRTVIFMNGCKLRCKYCHNPEMWCLQETNYTPSDLVEKIVRFKPYFGNSGGVTFSGGEPLLQPEFLIETMKLLKKENIHIALDTAGVGVGHYEEILKYTDLVLLDIKHIEKNKYTEITGYNIDEVEKFIEEINRQNKEVWIRQVIVPGIMDNDSYLTGLKEYLKRINNIKRIDFLPYHKLGEEKYKKLNIEYPYKDVNEMDKDKCEILHKKFMKLYEENE